MIWFTSDTHFGHKRIIELSDRPFKDVTHMNEMIVHHWNAVVAPEDTVYHLGDVALGPIEDSLKYISRLNGRKILVVGNHDRMFPPMAKGNLGKMVAWTEKYKRAGFDSVVSNKVSTVYLRFLGREFETSHFPYDGDHTREDRYSEYRLKDEGVPLIHGHTHLNSKFSRSKNGTPQIHVGQDAWDFTPVSITSVIEILDGEK